MSDLTITRPGEAPEDAAVQAVKRAAEDMGVVLTPADVKRLAHLTRQTTVGKEDSPEELAAIRQERERRARWTVALIEQVAAAKRVADHLMVERMMTAKPGVRAAREAARRLEHLFELSDVGGFITRYGRNLIPAWRIKVPESLA